ncbi:MAG: EpsI family protein [Acidobacteria bacterium]|nr:EpsI family protein [Acidobacteriota bacterium]
MQQRSLNPLKSKPFVLLAVVLVTQALVLRAVSRPENITPPAALASFPFQVEGWKLAQEGYVDAETREILKADDLLSRTYYRPGDRGAVSLFIASFLSQRNGKAPHSPKNCLPGSGWVQDTSEILPVEIPGVGIIEVNHYLVSNRESKSDVIYWYQSRNRVVANEYKAKLFVMADAIRYNRTDTALVRVISPVIDRQDEPALRTNVEFIRAAFPIVREFLPK